MNRSYLIVVLCIITNLVFAQSSVFPGDANANGIVDQYDIPSIGYGVGATGPARLQNDDASVPQTIPQLWNNSFPSGLNLIHADVDGNGAVNLFDFFIWNENYGIVHDVITPVQLSENTPDGQAVFQWNNNQIPLPLTGGASIEVPINVLLNLEQPVNGLAFRLSYRPTHFATAFFSTADNWLKSDGNGISLQNNAPGVINVGMTRLGNNPVSGGGTCGTLSLIIIDDMIDLLETAPDTMSTWLKIEGVQLLDGDLAPVSVSVDSFEIKLYRPGVIATTAEPLNELGATLYPNPSTGPCTISAASPFGKITLVDALGRGVYTRTFSPRRSWSLPDLNLAPGYYHLKVESSQGASWLKLLQQ